MEKDNTKFLTNLYNKQFRVYIIKYNRLQVKRWKRFQNKTKLNVVIKMN